MERKRKKDDVKGLDKVRSKVPQSQRPLKNISMSNDPVVKEEPRDEYTPINEVSLKII